MNEVWTLNNLFERFPGGIRIPRIQRGYVQGRDDAKGREIRENFLPALVSAFFEDKPLSLDFIYGVSVGDCLLPLDGQQRITTLFLLTWLCGRWERNWRFEYESRRIPQLFVEGLVSHPYAANAKPSVEIENADWFLPVWKNDSTVSGMLRMLDALHVSVVRFIDKKAADVGNVTFLLHGLVGENDTFDHVFRKMNARGKELSAWENLKAMLDKYVPKSLSDLWRGRTDNDWPETIWPHVRKSVVHLDNALEKTVRLAYAQHFGLEAQDVSLWDMEKRLSENRETAEVFFETAIRCFDSLDVVADQWSKDRKNNVLWGNKGDRRRFWEWLAKENSASTADQLRFAFLVSLTNAPDAERRRRVLLNLLDASSIDRKKAADALAAGLEFLSGHADLAAVAGHVAGYSVGQLKDESRKWALPADEVMSFEKDELVHWGSLRFIGWADFKDANDVRLRLESIRSAIGRDWIDFYRNLVSRIPAIGEREFVHVPVSPNDILTWREKVLTNRRFIEALAAWHASSAMPENVSGWVSHLCELLANGKVKRSSLRKIDGWMFLLQNEKRRLLGKSIRLDYNDKEQKNRQLLKKGEVYYAAPWPWAESKEDGTWFNVCNESWWTSDAPPRLLRNADGSFTETALGEA
jgi:hypothetical protein